MPASDDFKIQLLFLDNVTIFVPLETSGKYLKANFKIVFGSYQSESLCGLMFHPRSTGMIIKKKLDLC